jgi:hypothetical protein
VETTLGWYFFTRREKIGVLKETREKGREREIEERERDRKMATSRRNSN